MGTARVTLPSKSLDVTVEYEVHPGDASVGMDEDIEFEIVEVGRSKCRKPPNWLYNKMTDRDDQAIYDAIAEDCAAERGMAEERAAEDYADFDERR